MVWLNSIYFQHMLMAATFGVAIPALTPIRYMYQGEAQQQQQQQHNRGELTKDTKYSLSLPFLLNLDPFQEF
jgi:hypothetical protein